MEECKISLCKHATSWYRAVVHPSDPPSQSSTQQMELFGTCYTKTGRDGHWIQRDDDVAAVVIRASSAELLSPCLSLPTRPTDRLGAEACLPFQPCS
jgi:hypothetical protein